MPPAKQEAGRSKNIAQNEQKRTGAMIDILYLAHGRPEFTEASLKALVENTELGVECGVSIYFDGDDYPFVWKFSDPPFPKIQKIHEQRLGGPVACLNHFIRNTSSELIAKIDNDTMVPPGWLDACVDVMRRYPGVDLLGIEPWTPDETLFWRWSEPQLPCAIMDYPDGSRRFLPSIRPPYGSGFVPRAVSHIGGIGIFRRSAFVKYGLPTSNTQDGRYGFTEWQWAHPEMTKAFLDPPLPVFLLDHLPFSPWAELSEKYERAGIQRGQWGKYDAEKHKALWSWWKA